MFKTLKQQTILFMFAKYATVFVGIIVSAILSRLLTPTDYGVVAVITVFTTLFTTLGNVGLGTAVIQRRDLLDSQVNDIFSFSVYLSLVLMLIFMGCSFPIANFYENDVYIPVCTLLSFSVLFNSLNMVPNACLMRDHKFNLVSVRMIICAVVSGLIAICMALCNFKYYSLVAQSVISAFLQFVWNLRGSKLKLKIRFNFEPLKSIWSYSWNQFLYNLCNYFAQNLDNLLTGKLISSDALAFYNKSYTLMRYPVNNIPHVLTPILHPILSEHSDDRNYIYTHYICIVKLFSLIGVFVSLVCYFSGEELVMIFFGNQWSQSVVPFKILSLCLWAQIVDAIAGSIYQSLGKTKEMFHSGVIHIGITIFAIIIGSIPRNIVILSFCVSLSLNIKFFIESFFLIKKSFKFPLIPYYMIFIPDVAICIVTAIGTSILCTFVNLSNVFVSFAFKLCIISFIYLISLLLKGQYKFILMKKKKK